MQTVTQPNGVVHSYGYDQKNRLTNLAAAGGSGANPANFSCAYTVDNAGHRTSVTEKSGRTGVAFSLFFGGSSGGRSFCRFGHGGACIVRAESPYLTGIAQLDVLGRKKA